MAAEVAPAAPAKQAKVAPAAPAAKQAKVAPEARAAHRRSLPRASASAYQNIYGGYPGGAVYEDLNPSLIGDVPFEAFVQEIHQMVLSDFIYFGSPTSDGTVRMGNVGTSFQIQRRVGGTWTALQSW